MPGDPRGWFNRMAPSPKRELDMARIERRGRSLLWRRRVAVCVTASLVAGAGWGIALGLATDRHPPVTQDPSPSPSVDGGPQDHAVAGQILGLLSDRGLLVGANYFRDYAGIARSTTGWTLYFGGDDCERSEDEQICLEDSADWVWVEPRFAGTQLKITGVSPAFGDEVRSLLGETVFLSTGRARFSLGPPLLDRSGDAVAVQAPFVWSGPVPSNERSLRGCAFVLSDSQGPVGRSTSTFLISPPTSEGGRDGVLRDTVAVPSSLPLSRSLSMNLECSGGVRRPVQPMGVCQEGIDGPGNEQQEHLGPKPYFEVFNWWSGDFRGDCLQAGAGRQQDRDISGPGLQEPHYLEGGVLEIFGGYLRPNRIEWFESDLPQPIRLVDYRRSGEDVELIVQSLVDCSLGAFDLDEAGFVSVPAWVDAASYPCVTEQAKESLPAMVTHDCFHAKAFPRSIIFACGDHGYYAKHLVWITWDERATGLGRFYFKVFTGPGAGLHSRDGAIELTGKLWCPDAALFIFEHARILYERPWKDRRSFRFELPCPMDLTRP